MDILPFSATENEPLIVYPTIWLDTNYQNQDRSIQAGKEEIYTKCIPYLQEKYAD